MTGAVPAVVYLHIEANLHSFLRSHLSKRYFDFDDIVRTGNNDGRFKTIRYACRVEGGFIIVIYPVLPVVILVERCFLIVFIYEDFNGILLPWILASFIKLLVAYLEQDIQVLSSQSAFAVPFAPAMPSGTGYRQLRSIAPNLILLAVYYGRAIRGCRPVCRDRLRVHSRS